MAKQTQKPAAENAANVSEAEVVVSTEVVQIVPVENTGKAVTLFTPANTEKLVQLFVNSEVVNFESTPEACAALIKSHKKKVVKDKDDAKGYEAVKAAYNEMVKVRTSTDKKRAEIVKPYVDIKAGIDKYAKTDIIGALAAEEARLKAEKDKYEKWEQEEKDRKEREAEELAKKRVAELKEAGIVFNAEAGFYEIADISVDIVTVKKLSENDYTILLAKVKTAKEKIDKEAADAAAAKAKEEADAAALKAENERKAKELRDEKLELRREKLEAAGFTDDPKKERFHVAGTGYFFELTYDEAAEYNAADFKAYLESAAAKIEEVTRAAQAATEAEQQKQAAAPATEQAAAAQEAQAENAPATDDTPQTPYGQENEPETPQDKVNQDAYNLRVYYTALASVQAPIMVTERGVELYAALKNELKHAIDRLENDIQVYVNG